MTDDIDVAGFARSFGAFLERYGDAIPPQQSTIRRLADEHLGVDPSGLPSFTERFDASEHANLQLALDALLSARDDWTLLGLPAELHQFGSFSLASIPGGRFHGPSEPCAPADALAEAAARAGFRWTEP